MTSRLITLTQSTCINNLISDPICNTGTGAPDITCVCTSRTLIDTVSCCIYQACSANDQARALELAQGVCGGVSGEVLPQAAGCTGSTSASVVVSTATETATVTDATVTASSVASSVTSAVAAVTGVSPPNAGGRAEVMFGGAAGVAVGLAGLLL